MGILRANLVNLGVVRWLEIIDIGVRGGWFVDMRILLDTCVCDVADYDMR